MADSQSIPKCQAVPGCDRPLRTAKHCNGHEQQRRKGLPFTPLKFDRPVKLCAFDGCQMAGVAAGWCATHRKQILTHGATWEIGTKIGKETSRISFNADGTAEVELSNAPDHACIIDAADAELVAPYRWYRAPTGYAQASPRTKAQNYKLWMHRVILGITGSGRIRQTDHINGDRLDNRRVNLREVTPAENAQNAVRPDRKVMRGAYFDKRGGYWYAKVQVNYKSYSRFGLKSRDEAIEAARQLRAEHLTHHNESRHTLQQDETTRKMLTR